MRFLYTILLPALLGFLVSCSSGKQHFTTSASWGSYPSVANKTNCAGVDQNLANSTKPSQEGPIYASVQPDLPSLPLSSQSTKLYAPDYSATTDKAISTQLAVTAKPSAEVKAPVPPPGSDKTYRFGLFSLISGILAFAPFVLGLSLLYAIPFALVGIYFGYKVVGKRKGYRQRGVALAKAGLLMSGIIAIVLILLGAMAIAGG